MGSGQEGGFAIDDTIIEKKSCNSKWKTVKTLFKSSFPALPPVTTTVAPTPPPTTTTTTTLAPPSPEFGCDFEDETTCQWEQGGWSIATGAEGAWAPTEDHTMHNGGMNNKHSIKTHTIPFRVRSLHYDNWSQPQRLLTIQPPNRSCQLPVFLVLHAG